MRCFWGHRGSLRDLVLGGTHIPLFPAGGHGLGLGQGLSASCGFLAGKDGTVRSPQQTLVPCVVRVQARLRQGPQSPSLCCPGPRAVLGRVRLRRFQTLRVLHEGRRGARLGSRDPQQRLKRLAFRSVWCFSFPDQELCPQGCPGLVVRGQAVAQGEQVAFRGHRFIHPLRSEISEWMCLGLPVLPLLSGCHLGAGSIWGCLRLMKNVKDLLCGCRCSYPDRSPCMWILLWQEPRDSPAGGDFRDSVCVQTHVVIALSHSASVAPRSATLCVSPAFPQIPPPPPLPPPAPGLILATRAGNVGGSQSQKLGRF